jgi:hypothetical protein
VINPPSTCYHFLIPSNTSTDARYSSLFQRRRRNIWRFWKMDVNFSVLFFVSLFCLFTSSFWILDHCRTRSVKISVHIDITYQNRQSRKKNKQKSNCRALCNEPGRRWRLYKTSFCCASFPDKTR